LIQMIFTKQVDNTLLVTRQFLKLLKVNVTETTLEYTLTSHPDYPAFASISDALVKWKISNMIARIDPDKLSKMDVPFITRLKTGEGMYVVVKNITEESVTFLSPKKLSEEITQDLKDFKNSAVGIAILAEPNEFSGEQDYRIKRSDERWHSSKVPLLLFTIFGFTLAFSLIGTFSLVRNPSTFISLAWIKLVGCLVSGILLTHEISQNNPLLRFVCKPGKKINCNSVLNSRGAKLFGKISWSEIGFFYFGGSYLAILSGSFSAGTLALLGWLSILALPYIFYSVYYQWRIVRQWCLLCLLVQSLLLTEGAVALFGHILGKPFALTASNIFLFALSFIVPVISWLLLKKTFIQANAAEGYRKEYLQLKHDTSVFKSHLVAQRRISADALPRYIVWGNDAAANSLTMICSPYCKPCAIAFPVVSDILEILDDLKVELVFDVANFQDDRVMNPVRHLLWLFKNDNSPEKVEEVLQEWWMHALKDDYAGFSTKFEGGDFAETYDSAIKEMHNWCVNTGIDHTPTFFLNGFELSGTYTIEDMKAIITSSRWNWSGI
jgi:uncharacterized membrane protein/protein-disulfide isomerase